jgi:hypothetical protein
MSQRRALSDLGDGPILLFGIEELRAEYMNPYDNIPVDYLMFDKEGVISNDFPFASKEPKMLKRAGEIIHYHTRV